LCHPAALAFAPLLFLYKLLFEERPSWRTVPRTLALCVPAAVVSLLVFAEPGTGLAAITISTDGMIRALITLVSPESGLPGEFPPLANVSAIVILAAAAIYASLRLETRPLAFGLFWFIAMLSVVPDNFLPAYVGVAIIIAWLIGKLLVLVRGTRRWLVMASCAILLAACGTGVTQRNGSSTPAANSAPGPPSMDSLVQPNMTAEQWLNLSLYAYQGKRYLESIAAAQTALRLKPDYADAYNNIAASYAALHLWDFAIAAAQEALRINPNYTLARNNLNWALEQKRLATH
jgi:hypothetical protein